VLGAVVVSMLVLLIIGTSCFACGHRGTATVRVSYPIYPCCDGPVYPPGYSAPAEIRVRVPTPDAKLKIDGRVTSSTGRERFFTSPPLEFGKTYTFVLELTVKGAGKDEDTVLEKKVDVKAGGLAEVVFELPAEPGKLK
jgi:uncharacterized protein (TIGR03000 family)